MCLPTDNASYVPFAVCMNSLDEWLRMILVIHFDTMNRVTSVFNLGVYTGQFLHNDVELDHPDAGKKNNATK